MMIEHIVAPDYPRSRITPKYLAVHSTANLGTPAINHVKYWSREPKFAVHAVSDWKEAYHTVPWDLKCNQVGNGNSVCIGIEICEANNYDDFMHGMEIARDTIWEMLDMKGWNVDDHVRSHLWFTQNYGGSDHTDPIPYLKKWGKDWNWFINFLKQGKSNIAIVGGKPVEIKENSMQCIFQPDDKNHMVFYDGTYIHPFSHPDEVEAVQMVARATIGHDLPTFKLGSKDAPWATRFMDVVNRGA